jgi:hypothetical protein
MVNSIKNNLKIAGAFFDYLSMYTHGAPKAKRTINMVKAIMLALIIPAILTIGNGRVVMGSPLDLSQFKWKNRVLLLFAPGRSHPFFDNLHLTIMNRKGEVNDRDLVIFEIFESGPSNVNLEELDSPTVRSLRKKFNITEGEFAVILIGRDGGIKLNRREQTAIEDIFGLIDSMPMRQEEMRGKSRNP